MKRLMEALRSARKIEVLLITAVLCIMFLLYIGDGGRQSGQEASTEEIQMQQLLSRIEGAGEVSVMLARNEKGEAAGAVVVAQGADDIRVVLELQRSVHALTGLDLEHIEIVKSGEGGWW